MQSLSERKGKQEKRCGSSAWLECRPVTPEVAACHAGGRGFEPRPHRRNRDDFRKVVPVFRGSPGKPCVNIEQNSSIDITESEQEIADVRDTSELSSESLYLCIERFRGGVCGTVVKEVQDILVVIVYSLLDGPEDLASLVYATPLTFVFE